MFIYLPRFQSWPLWKKWAVPVLSTLGFVIAFFSLIPLIGNVGIILSFIPVLFISWTMGKRTGIVAGCVAVLVNYSLLKILGADATTIFTRGVLSSLTLILLGGLMGWVSQLVEKLRTYTGQLEQDRAALMESNSRYQAVMMQSTACIFLVDVDNLAILESNTSFRNLLGYSEREMGNLTLYDIVAHSRESVQERIRIIREQGSMVIGERQYRTKDDRRIDMDVRVNLLHYADKEVMCIVSNDITARKRADAQLRSSLQEKEVLLKEIHHRVKNNLQIVSSLLNLQSVNEQEPRMLELFQDSQNRVRSMALIHERLYRSHDLARINFHAYLHDLAGHLMNGYRSLARITLRIEAEDIFLDTDTAIPCGLLVNELISNSLKHAFPNGREGEIWIEMRQDSHGHYRLVVRDNGVGLPIGLNWQETGTLGLQLVHSLVHQLDGEVEISSDAGARFAVEIPITPAKEKIPV